MNAIIRAIIGAIVMAIEGAISGAIVGAFWGTIIVAAIFNTEGAAAVMGGAVTLAILGAILGVLVGIWAGFTDHLVWAIRNGVKMVTGAIGGAIGGAVLGAVLGMIGKWINAAIKIESVELILGGIGLLLGGAFWNFFRDRSSAESEYAKRSERIVAGCGCVVTIALTIIGAVIGGVTKNEVIGGAIIGSIAAMLVGLTSPIDRGWEGWRW